MYEQHIGLFFYVICKCTLKPLKNCSFKSKSLVQFIFHTLILPGNIKNYLYETLIMKRVYGKFSKFESLFQDIFNNTKR